jgi:hypothetical protein
MPPDGTMLGNFTRFLLKKISPTLQFCVYVVSLSGLVLTVLAVIARFTGWPAWLVGAPFLEFLRL